jgi:hypothetical protein
VIVRGQRVRAGGATGIVIDGQRYTAHVRDVGSGGIGAMGAVPIRAGQDVIVVAHGVSIAAQCRWVSGNSFGLVFAVDTNPADIARFRRGALKLGSGVLTRRMHGFVELGAGLHLRNTSDMRP